MAIILPWHSAQRSVSGTTDNLARLQVLVAPDMDAVNQLIVNRLSSHVPLIPKLAGCLIAAGGKRLRPMLTLASALLCGYEGERHRKLAAAVEFIHTATLLHDDVVDESDLRRGAPSANALYGNEASVLVGDFLLSRAFQLMVEDGSIDVLRVLANASAVIAEGEVLQMGTVNCCATSEQTYLDVIHAKTAELFAAACRIGALVAGRSFAEEEALRTFGLNLGIAFQIVDDVQDYTASAVALGKKGGNDFHEGKVTLPVILAVHRSDRDELAFWHRVFDEEQRSEKDLGKALEILHRRHAFTDSIARARHYGDIACDALGLFPDHPAKKALLDLVSFVVEPDVTA